ncbi:hypothetical protein Tco_0418729 [Tanacetum coccineum]
MPRGFKRNTHEEENYTEISVKETQRAPNDWIASVAIRANRVLQSHLTATTYDPIIRRNQQIRSKAGRSNYEVDKTTVDKQSAELKRKAFLIENEKSGLSKLISKLEREYLNLQLKYQHLQESFDNKRSQASQEAPDFNSFFKIKNLEHQIQEKDNVIGHLKDLVANVNDRSREPYNAIDELYDSIKIMRAHTSEKTSTMLNEIESLKAQLRSKEPCFTSGYVKPRVLAPSCRYRSWLRYLAQAAQTYDGESFKAHEFCGKVHRPVNLEKARSSHTAKSEIHIWKFFIPSHGSVRSNKRRGIKERNAPSISDSSSTSDIHLPVQHQDITEEPIQEDTPIIHDVLHPSHNLITVDLGSAQSSSGNVNATEPNQVKLHIQSRSEDGPKFIL